MVAAKDLGANPIRLFHYEERLSTSSRFGTTRGPIGQGWTSAAAVIEGVMWATQPLVSDYVAVLVNCQGNACERS